MAIGKVRKGGDARYVLSNVAQGDSFVIPRGFKLRELISDTGSVVTTTAPSMTLSTTAPVNQVGTITVTGVASAASTVFSIGGIASGTQIALNNTVAQTVALIQSIFGAGGAQYGALLNAGWILTGFNTATGVVTYIGSPAKTSTAPVIVTTTLATQTVVSAVVTNGSRGVDVMTSQNLATAVATITDHTSSIVSGQQFLSANNTDKIVVTFTGAAGQTGNGYYNICGQQSVAIANGTVQNTIASTLGAMKIPGYTLTSSTNTLTIQATSAGAGVPAPTFYSWAPAPVTTTTFTSVVTSQDKTVYVGIDLNAVGNANIYAVLQKLN